MKHVASMRFLVIQIEVEITFFIIFIACMSILFIIHMKNFMLIKWSYRSLPPPIMLTIMPKKIFIFLACIPISFKHMSFWYSFLKGHLITYHSNIGDLKRKVIGIWVVYLKFNLNRYANSSSFVGVLCNT